MIKVRTNLDTLVEHIGAYMGMADAVEQPGYLSELMDNAHRLTVPDFTKAAAAGAKGMNFTHMYEYGVKGLTRGDSQTIDPTSQRARLWKDVIVGNGSRKVITFVYRNATQRVPKHTTAETGIKQEELDKLKLNQGKRYTFEHKAEIFEQGIDLNIHPKKSGGVLFVPLRDSGITGTTKDRERGFTWRKKLRINPGELHGSVGQFSFFFYDWWGRQGNALMIQRMERSVTGDIKRFQNSLPSGGSLRDPKSIHPTQIAEASRRKTRKQFTIWVRREDGDKEVTGL